ncbi:hypothetical protein Hanom_Chr14g01303381 [Helianthus anomalus]
MFHELLSNVDGFYVSFVVDELSSKKVLTTELKNLFMEFLLIRCTSGSRDP